MRQTLSPYAYKTYQILAPVQTHFRPASCEEVDCAGFLNGFVVTIDLSTDLGQSQAYYFRNSNERSFREESLSSTLVRFVFGPGQPCVARHRHQVRLDRPELYLVKKGNTRQSFGIETRHTSADSWRDDFATNQESIAKIRGEG